MTMNSAVREHIKQLSVRGYDLDGIGRQLHESVSEKQIKEVLGTGQAQPIATPRSGGRSALTTQSGRSISVLAPDPDSIDLGDIAHGLSAVCRFSGQTRLFYSVAEHSMMVAKLVPSELRLRALLHDATEAYIQDLPTPIKVFLPGYAAIEKRLWGAIASHFGLPAEDAGADAQIKRADQIALRVEMRDLFKEHPSDDSLPEPPDDLRIEISMPPLQAKRLFLSAVIVAQQARRS